MISGISGDMMAGGGIEAIESRMQQIEGMINSLRSRQADFIEIPTTTPSGTNGQASAPAKPVSFQSFLKDGSGSIPPGNIPNASGSAQSLSIQTGNPHLTARAQQFQPMIADISQRHGVDQDLVNALIQQESGFNPEARSHSGAMGLMQLMPTTAKHLGVSNASDPQQNLEGGVSYLKGLLNQFNGNIPLALAAYNAGPGAVGHYKGIPPYQETQNYVRNILATYLKTKQGNA